MTTFWEQAGITDPQDQMHYLSRQAELLDEQGHDVSAQVMREAARLVVSLHKELAKARDDLMLKAQQCTAERLRANAAEERLRRP